MDEAPGRAEPRPEYPRPQFVRDSWRSLNGVWAFAWDDNDCGLDRGWYETPRLGQEILVPFPYQSRLSGTGETALHDVVWYRRRFQIPAGWRERRVLLHFGAVDYRAHVWVNGRLVAFHEGGHTPFSADITPHLASDNEVVVRAEDITTDRSQPRGKQFWEAQPAGIFYTGSSGIWQPVWLEAVAPVHLTGVTFTPQLERGAVTVAAQSSSRAAGQELEVTISLGEETVAQETLALGEGQASSSIALAAVHLWAPETPHLYDVVLRLQAGDLVVDAVRAYFGMREVGVAGDRFLLNGEPYSQRLVLDQGYYADGLLAAPSDAALRQDVEWARALGFNGVRKHQTVADPRYLYWADRLGLLVWGEMANAYRFDEAARRRLLHEWQAVIARDTNHPAIVAWVPVNESWGVPALQADPRQTDFLLALYHLTHALDGTRPVVSNDGWEHARSDLLTIHDYSSDEEELARRYASLETALAFRPAKRPLFAPGHSYEGQPVLVSECGGIAFQREGRDGWGYTTAEDEGDFVRRYREVVAPLRDAPLLAGFCYTQLTDVQQEINGLLTAEREPKVDPALLRAINLGQDV